MNKYVKNTHATDTQNWVGQDIPAGEYFEIENQKIARWQNSSPFLIDLASGLAVMAKDDSGDTDITDVNDSINYLKDTIETRDEDGTLKIKQKVFAEANGFRARFKGISGTADKDSTTNIDFKIEQERYINGLRLILENHQADDTINLEVVDVDNILGYGAGTVLDRFGEDWAVDPGVCTQQDVIVPYPAKIMAGLYLRIAYTSTGTADDVKVKANLYLHWKGA